MTEIKRIKGGTDNCYVVANGKSAILIDTASKPYLDKVIEECDKYEMKLIVLTHVHFDHAENAAELSKRYNIPVAIHKADEDDLSSYGINAKIIELPGHTFGSIGVDVEEKHLFVGDELDNWITPGVGHLYTDFDAIKKSADKIKSLGNRTIYYGHGKPKVKGSI